MSSQNSSAAAPELADQGSPAEVPGMLGPHGQECDVLNQRSEDYLRDAAWADHSWQ